MHTLILNFETEYELNTYNEICKHTDKEQFAKDMLWKVLVDEPSRRKPSLSRKELDKICKELMEEWDS